MTLKEAIAAGSFSLLAIFLFAFIPMYGCPTYNVWKQGKYGEADLKKAEQTKHIMVEQAKAERESAELKAQAIEIVGKAAKEYPEYRHQEFIHAFGEALHNGSIDKIIYVPTEANIPIIEAKKD